MAGRSLENLRSRYDSGSAVPGKNAPGPMMGRGGRGPGRGMAMGKPKNMKQTVLRVFSYLAPYKFRLVLVLICMLLSTAGSLAASYMLRPILNALVETDVPLASRLSTFITMLAVLAGAYLVGVAASFFQYRIMVYVSQHAIASIRHDLFEKLQKLPVRYFDSHSNGDVMSRFTNDVDNMGQMLDHSILAMITGIITLVGTFGMMVYTNIWLTLITVAFLPLFLFASSFILKRSRKYYVAQQSALGAANGYIEENVAGQKIVKVFNHEDTCREEFNTLNDDLREKQQKALFFGGLMGPILGNTAKISYALTAGIGAIFCVTSGFDVGGLAIFVNYSSQFARPINELSQQVSTILSALAGAERVFAVMDEKPEAADAENASATQIKGDVCLSHVNFGYVPGKPVLKDISLYAHPGQKIAFVGSTGAGKTTITNLLNRFYDIDSGSITIDGKDLKEYPLDYLRSNIAMVLQDTHLFSGTIEDNIRYGRPDATEEEVRAAARTAGAMSFIRKLPEGFKTRIEGDGANLSQGQRQLLNIARAAISKAPILVLDEATSSVDTRTERMIERGMDQIMQNRTTFVIAHRLSTVRNANAIMVLEKGEIIERGEHDELLAMKGRYCFISAVFYHE